MTDERNPVAAQLEALAALHEMGTLTDEEFAAAKRRVLGTPDPPQPQPRIWPPPQVPNDPATNATADAIPFRKRHPLVVVALSVVVVLFIIGAVAGSSDENKADSPEYKAAQQHCVDTVGAQWYADHPYASSDNPQDVDDFAGVINRCLVDTYGVDPKYLPNKPLAP
ncbi:MAG: hypothetical protein QOK28_1999 [Actinomycetota bacterium]|jgi:hypothetical protein